MGKYISKEDREVQLQGICREYGYTFNGWVEGYTNLYSRISISNPVTNNVWEKGMYRFIRSPEDPAQDRIRYCEDTLKGNENTSKYTLIKRVADTLDRRMIFSFKCPDCGELGLINQVQIREDTLQCVCATKGRGVTLYGVGIKDVRTSCDTCPYYIRWGGMIRRCYSDNERDRLKFRWYNYVTVCEEWKVFSNFMEWCKQQEKLFGISIEGFHVDKDLKGGATKGKHYSAENCCLVTPAVNSFLTDSLAARGEQPLGVYFRKGKFVAQIKDPFSRGSDGKTNYLYLGAYDSREEAHLVWAKNKMDFAKRLTQCPVNNPNGILGTDLVGTYSKIYLEAKHAYERQH